LVPLFSALDAIEAECVAIRADGERRAREISNGAVARIARIGADAAMRAAEARVAADAATRYAAEERNASTLAAAERAAADAYALGLELLPDRVANAVSKVRSLASMTG
jgi:hypothetical protein